jgi:hypothetical protein
MTLGPLRMWPNHKVIVPTEPILHLNQYFTLFEHTEYVLFDYVEIMCHDRDLIRYEQIENVCRAKQ